MNKPKADQECRNGGKRVAISQSNYIPWRGYFDVIRSVDEFIFYDEVQFTRRDWRNRNQIKTAQGLLWLTIPVMAKGRYHQTIRETHVTGGDWAAAHWRTIRESYSKAGGFEEVAPVLDEAFERCATYTQLIDINRDLLAVMNRLLEVSTPMRCSSEFRLEGEKSERLLNICLEAGAAVYVSGPAAKSYLDVELFREAGVSVEWFDYAGYPTYPQLHGAFEPAVSVVDLLLNTGRGAAAYLERGGKQL